MLRAFVHVPRFWHYRLRSDRSAACGGDCQPAGCQTRGLLRHRRRSRAAAGGQFCGGRVFASQAELLADNSIDIVTICTPSGDHLEPALAAAAAGKHLLVEKPLEISALALRSDHRRVRAGRAVVDDLSAPLSQLIAEAQAGHRRAAVRPADAGRRLREVVFARRTTTTAAPGAARGSSTAAAPDEPGDPQPSICWPGCWVPCAKCGRTPRARPRADRGGRHGRGQLAVRQAAPWASSKPARRSILAIAARWPSAARKGASWFRNKRSVRWDVESSPSTAAKLAKSARLVAATFASRASRSPATAGSSTILSGAIRAGEPPLLCGSEGRRAVELVLAIYEASRTGTRVRLNS